MQAVAQTSKQFHRSLMVYMVIHLGLGMKRSLDCYTWQDTPQRTSGTWSSKQDVETRLFTSVGGPKAPDGWVMQRQR